MSWRWSWFWSWHSQADPAASRPVGGDRLFIVVTVVTAALTGAVLLVLGGTFVLLRAGLRRLGPVLMPVPKG